MALSRLFSLFRSGQPAHALAAPSIPTVDFDSERVTASVRADIRLTLKAAGDIPKNKLPAIGRVAIASVESGRDLGMLHSAIMSSDIVGMTEQRAAEITRHIHDRATSIMDVERMTGLGIEEAVWSYSGAPCYPNAKSPSPEQIAVNAAHEVANGKRYRVREGLTVGEKRTWPGREVGCKCLSKAVVPGFS